MTWQRVSIPLLLATLAGCVQPAYDKTVILELDVSGHPAIRTVGVRGNDRPLSWNDDVTLVAVVPDSLYRATVTYHTGYLKSEVKFTINGEFELQDGENRRVPLTTGDTTVYRAKFNVRP